MSSWLPLVVHLAREGGESDHRELEQRLDRLGDAVVNRTPLLESGEHVGALIALREDSWDSALELADDLTERARAFRVAAELVAGRENTETREQAFVSLDANLDGASLHFDDPAVSGAMRATLGEYLPVLGRRLLGTSSLMVEDFNYGGAITAFTASSRAQAAVLAARDSWACIYPARLLSTSPGFFARNPAPPGPGIQRYRNLPCPGGLYPQRPE